VQISVVSKLAHVYTFGRYVREDIVFLYEVFCCMGDAVWGDGVFLAESIRDFRQRNELVFYPNDVRDRGGTAS